MTTRPTIHGTRHAVSAGHYLAAAAAFAILEAGGNAIDAGCAAGIALGVLQPDLVNVAGVAPILIRYDGGRVESIAGLGHWLVGSVDWHMLASLLVGSIPGIVVGTLLSVRLPDWFLRPVLAITLLMVGGKLLLVGDGAEVPLSECRMIEVR